MTTEDLRELVLAGLARIDYIDRKILCAGLLGLSPGATAMALGITYDDVVERRAMATDKFRHTTGQKMDVLQNFLRALPDEEQRKLLGELHLELVQYRSHNPGYHLDVRLRDGTGRLGFIMS